MKRLWSEFKLSSRRLYRNRGLTVVAILSLAIGIGPSIAIFSVVKGVLLKPLPFPNGDRVVWIWGTSISDNQAPASVLDFLDLRQKNNVFEHCAIFVPLTFRFGEDSKQVSGLGVSAGFFEVFGVPPALGRTFVPAQEHGETAYRVVILSDGLWKRNFGADPNIIGKTIELNGRTTTVIGVMPEGYGALPTQESSHFQYELWKPLNLDQTNFQKRSFRYFNTVARLRSGVGMEQAKAEMATLARHLEKAYPDTNQGRGLRLDSARHAIVGDVEPLLVVLMVAVVITFLIACSNAANLLLAHAINREGDFALRLALGARWWHIFRELLCDAFIVSLTAGIAGFGLGAWGVRVLLALSPERIGRLNEVNIDGRVILFALLISIFSGLLVASIPTLRTSHIEPRESLQTGGLRGKGAHLRRGLGTSLVVGEVALAVVLMTSAVAMVKNLQRLLDGDTGFDADRVVTAWVDKFSNELLERVLKLKGVAAAGAVSDIPFGGWKSSASVSTFSAEGKSSQENADHNTVFRRQATPDYFRAMGIPLQKGSSFTWTDDRDVVIISQFMADRIWPREDPIGKRITVNAVEPFQARIVGVVGNVRQLSLDQDPWQDIYSPWTTDGQVGMNVVVRGNSNLIPTVQAVLSDFNRGKIPPDVRSMREIVRKTAAGRRFVVWLLGVFSALATFLALVGVYGTFSYWASKQLPALAVRTALGALPRDLVVLLLGRCLRLVTGGILLGLITSFVLGLLIRSRIPGLNLIDPVLCVLACLGFAALSIFAVIGPALRAATVDPAVSLKCE